MGYRPSAPGRFALWCRARRSASLGARAVSTRRKRGEADPPPRDGSRSCQRASTAPHPCMRRLPMARGRQPARCRWEDIAPSSALASEGTKRVEWNGGGERRCNSRSKPGVHPTCGQEGTLVTEQTDVEGQSVARGIFLSGPPFRPRRGGAESDRRHHHLSHWGYFMMMCPTGHHFGSRQSVCPPCWCSWPEISSADRTE
jgi:hypothetical protein